MVPEALISKTESAAGAGQVENNKVQELTN